MLKRIKNAVPNTITCLNLISGAIACILSFHYDEQLGALKDYEWAFLFIGAAAVFDFCDGASARLLGAYSAMGKELDSLADEISFGLAPSMLMFNTINYYNGASLSAWAFIALFIPAMGALRLAKFNIDDRQTTSFIGLPIPACAIFWIGTIGWINSHTYPGNIAMTVIIVAMSLMMVSNLPMFSLKFKNFNWKENFRRYAIIAATLFFLATEGVSGLVWTILLYILISVATRKEQSA